MADARLSKRRDLAAAVMEIASDVGADMRGPSDDMPALVAALRSEVAALRNELDAHKAAKAGQAHK